MVGAPSFLNLAAEYREDPVHLRSVMSRAHYPMRVSPVAGEDLYPLVAYILSLRPPNPSRP
jgi:hypothetical protein